MPIYEYHCTTCGAKKDVLQKMSDPVLTVCPECSAETFHRVLTAPAFQLKGTGWYVTDFRDGQSKKPTGAGNGAEAGGTSSKPVAAPDSGAGTKDAGSSAGSAPKSGESSATGSA